LILNRQLAKGREELRLTFSRMAGLITVLILATIVSAADASAPPRVRQVFEELVQPGASSAEKSRQLDLFATIIDLVETRYAVKVDTNTLVEASIKGMRQANPAAGGTVPEKLATAAITAMLGALDPHSTYLDAKTYKEMRVRTSGEFAGLGIEVTMEDGFVKVVSPLDDTPAYRAGLKAGDLITHLDGDPVKSLTLGEAVGQMRGRVGSRILLTVRRAGGAPFDVAITRAKIVVRPVKWRLEGDVGYLRITSFNRQTHDAVRAAVNEIHSRSGVSLKGIVLDLRNNPGGLLKQSVAVADDFLESGLVVSVRGRKPKDIARYKAKSGDLARGLPMVTLVNVGSASAAEIVAGALQDHRRATIMGSRSFGKGTVQTIIPIKGHGALRLTTSLYYSPLGRSLQRIGIVPDFLIKGKEGTDRRREADLGGALAGTAGPPPQADTEIAEADCPAVGETEDRVLGCALAFIRAGRPGAFLAAIGFNSRQPTTGARTEFPRSSVAVSFPKVAPRPDDIAVIVGNADYSKQGKDIPDVKPGYADATAFKQYALQALGVREGNIIDLRDATGSQMVRVFGSATNHKGQLYDWVRRGRSRVHIYYVGHGAPGGAEGGAYLVPSDADGNRIDLNGYPLEVLYRNLGKLPARAITLVLEACFSGASQGGTVISNASPVFLKVKSVVVPPNVTLIAAGAANQMASWEKDGSHGLFTKYFLKAMGGEADAKPYGNGDGTVALKELDAYLKDTLTYYARRYYGRDQAAQIVVGKGR
jgi:carboxyl-terminal processing protease